MTQRFDTSTLETLEWPLLLDHLRRACFTPYGGEHWQNSPFLQDRPSVETHMAEVLALQTLLQRWGLPADWVGELPDLRPVLQRLEKGGLLSLAELHALHQTLIHWRNLVNFCSDTRETEAVQEWRIQAERLMEALAPLFATLTASLTEEGQLNEAHYPQLEKLRSALRIERDRVSRQLEGIIHRLGQKAETAPAVSGSSLTERNGRLVLPVRSGFQSRIPGWVHASSASGGTVFVEPEAAIAGNNRIQTLLQEVQDAVEQILRDLSEETRPYLSPLPQEGEGGAAAPDEGTGLLHEMLNWLGEMDRRLAGAQLARQLNAFPVDIVSHDQPTQVDLKQLRHPLMVLQNQEGVIGNTVTIGSGSPSPDPAGRPLPTGRGNIGRTLIITGPNTGGKTVLMKALGLSALMVWAGLPLPVADPQHSPSAISLFEPIRVDMGDPQSLTDHLSTFAGHLQVLKTCVNAGVNLSRALVLLDEVGSGTDPDEGAALAEAVLSMLTEKGALTVATSHLGRLKTLAGSIPGIVNASMSFDPERIRPTYHLIMGIPGTSHAITMAEKLGLNPEVIDRARAAMSAPVRDSAELLESMAFERQKLQEARTEAEAFRRSAKESYQKTEAIKQQLEADKRRIIQQFKAGLKDRLRSLEQRVEQLTRQIQREAVSVDTTRLEQLAHKAEMLETWGVEVLETATAQLEESRPKIKAGQLSVGDIVFSQRLNMKATVTHLPATPQGDVGLEAGMLKINVPWNDLEKLGNGPNSPKTVRKKMKPVTVADLDRAQIARPLPDAGAANAISQPDWIPPSWVCDVRGQRAMDALEQLEQFVDQAVLEGIDRIAVVHGLGTGALKRAIRDWLHDNRAIKTFAPAEAVDGGDGKTVVQLA